MITAPGCGRQPGSQARAAVGRLDHRPGLRSAGIGKELQSMIKIYGMPTCPYCEFVHKQIIGREDEFQFIDIGKNIRNMSAFTRLRDKNPVFDRMKAIGDVGIPAFVFEDGRVSIDPADAGLIEYGSPEACSLEDHKNGRKGC
jgi:glutaredoxin-related protein